MSLPCRSGEFRPFAHLALNVLSVMLVAGLCFTGPALAFDHEGHDDDGGVGVRPSDFPSVGGHGRPDSAADIIGERPALLHHMDQGDIDSHAVGFNEILLQGFNVFVAEWTTMEGAGRPNTNGAGKPTTHPSKYQFRRATAAGPDSGSCVSCHGSPRPGGAAGRNLNLFLGFTGVQDFDASGNPVSPGALSIDFANYNERNPPNLFGDGPLEVASREMSFELQAIRAAAKAEAASSGVAVTKDLVAKGVSFGKITAQPNGLIDGSQIQGVDWDLIVKAFGWKGGLNIRSFEAGGMNLHFGMQPREKFGRGTDPDGDGVSDELTCGDMTAEVVFTAALSPPGQVITGSRARRNAIGRGKAIFDASQCASCHTPKMYLDNPVYTEPGPFNAKAALLFIGAESPEGIAQGSTTVSTTFSVAQPFAFDLTRDGPRPRIERTQDGRGVIEAYTDLKRHVLVDGTTTFFGN